MQQALALSGEARKKLFTDYCCLKGDEMMERWHPCLSSCERHQHRGWEKVHTLWEPEIISGRGECLYLYLIGMILITSRPRKFERMRRRC